MHIHKLEKIWLIIGIGMLALFLLVVGVSAFAMGMQTPHSGSHHALDPTKVDEHPPFDEPGLTRIGDQHYHAVMTAYVFGYSPSDMEVPVGSTVDFTITSKDVVHGFQIIGTNVNMMVVPGEVNETSYTFTKPGEYLILCNEYCGLYHEIMQTRITVK
jgi:cytochrome c oxidase subunit II